MTEELLMDAMFTWLNLQEAIDAVKRNKRAAGIDGSLAYPVTDIGHTQAQGKQCSSPIICTARENVGR
jgi:hypothetical protein